MNQEMMLFQARQDFIDLHKELLQGKTVSLERYNTIASDLLKMDDLNFELMLHFVEQTDKFPIGQMWKEISAYILQVKKSGQWLQKKNDQLVWNLELKQVSTLNTNQDQG